MEPMYNFQIDEDSQECSKQIAIALRYDPERDFVPFVIAKGKCELARRIIDKAKGGVPIVKSQELANELFKLEILDMIPNKLYIAVAEILAFVQLGLTDK